MHSGQWRRLLRGRHVNQLFILADKSQSQSRSQTNLRTHWSRSERPTCVPSLRCKTNERCAAWCPGLWRQGRALIMSSEGGAKVESPTTCRVGMGHPLPGCWALGATAPSCSRVPLSWGSFGNGADREIERGVVVVLGSSRRWGLAPLDGAVRFGWRRRSVGMVV
jgi:hypothetical protein